VLFVLSHENAISCNQKSCVVVRLSESWFEKRQTPSVTAQEQYAALLETQEHPQKGFWKGSDFVSCADFAERKGDKYGVNFITC